jgi:hypothetical protein
MLFIPEIGKNTNISAKDHRNGLKLTLTSKLLIALVVACPMAILIQLR